MFLVAIDAGLPIVPVSIAGSRHVMLKGRLMTCPGDVTLTVHEPIPTAGVGRGGARTMSGQVADGRPLGRRRAEDHGIITCLTLSAGPLLCT